MPRPSLIHRPRPLLTLTAAAALMTGTLAGCGWFGGDDSSDSTTVTQTKPKVTADDPQATEPVSPGPEVAPKSPEPAPHARKPVPELPPELPSTQELAAKEVERIGGKVKFNKNGDVDEVDLSGLDITDEYLKLLEPFPFINVLNLTETSITDAGLEYLANREFLRFVYLYGTDIHGPGLVHLGTLPRLEHLCLDETYVGDAGLEHLSGSDHLEILHLRTKTPITAEGVRKLHSLKDLKKVQFNVPGPPADAIAALEAAIPGLAVNPTEEGDPALSQPPAPEPAP